MDLTDRVAIVTGAARGIRPCRGVPMNHESAGARFRAAVAAEQPLQVVGTITAYAARMARSTGSKAIYLSGGGVAAGSPRRLSSRRC